MLYHVIASVELKENLQNKMIKEEKQQKSIKTTGEISVEVEIESVSVASKGGSQNHIKAAKMCLALRKRAKQSKVLQNCSPFAKLTAPYLLYICNHRHLLTVPSNVILSCIIVT